jgi:hypothetical protein
MTHATVDYKRKSEGEKEAGTLALTGIQRSTPISL